MRFQAIVIGGGVVGLSTAWRLLESGLQRVLLVERHLLAAGGSGLGTGSVHTQRWHPTDTALVLRSRTLMQEVSERSGGTFRLFPVGRLTLAGADDAATVREYGRHLQATGVGAVELTPDEITGRFPGMNVSDAVVGLYTADDGTIYPPALVWTLAGLVRNRGGTMWEGCGVRRIVCRGGAASGIEIANGDTILGERIIVAAGIWTRQLLEASGLDLALKHVVAHTTVVSVGRQDRWGSIPSLLDAIEGVIAIPRNPGTIMASNATGEYQASNATTGAVLQAGSAAVQTAETALARKTLAQQNEIVAQLRHRYPDHDIRGAIGHWAGLLDATPDSHPYVGPYPALSSLWVGCGLTGYGVQRGPGVGDVLAHFALGRSPPVAVESYRLDRLDPALDFRIDTSGDNPFAGFKSLQPATLMSEAR